MSDNLTTGLAALRALEAKATPGQLERVGGSMLWVTGEDGAAVALIAEPECKNSSDIRPLELGSKRHKEAYANVAKIMALWNVAPQTRKVIEAAAALSNHHDNHIGAGHLARLLELLDAQSAALAELAAVLPKGGE